MGCHFLTRAQCLISPFICHSSSLTQSVTLSDRSHLSPVLLLLQHYCQLLAPQTFVALLLLLRMIFLFFHPDQCPLIARSVSVAHYQSNRVCCNWLGIGLEMSRKDLFPGATSLGANFAIGCRIMVPVHNGREVLIRFQARNWVEGILYH